MTHYLRPLFIILPTDHWNHCLPPTVGISLISISIRESVVKKPVIPGPDQESSLPLCLCAFPLCPSWLDQESILPLCLPPFVPSPCVLPGLIRTPLCLCAFPLCPSWLDQDSIVPLCLCAFVPSPLCAFPLCPSWLDQESMGKRAISS